MQTLKNYRYSTSRLLIEPFVVGNDKDWQRRSDDWVKSMHASRLKKERKLALKHLITHIENIKKKDDPSQH